jgi:hypothetical protein
MQMNTARLLAARLRVARVDLIMGSPVVELSADIVLDDRSR